jgi:hypothetical protein
MTTQANTALEYSTLCLKNGFFWDVTPCGSCKNKIRWAGHVSRMGEKRNVCELLVGKPEGKETTRKTET